MSQQFDPCAICNHPEATRQNDPGRDAVNWDCPRCGRFHLTGTREVTLPGLLQKRPEMRSALSHRIQRMQSQSSTGYPRVESQLITLVEKDPSLPSPAEQADNLILWIGDRLTGREGEQVPIHHNRDYARVGGSGPASMVYLLTELGRRKLIENANLGATQFESAARLTLDGWSRYEDLKRGKVDSRRAFMAMAFRDPKLDRVFNECFKPAVAQTGFYLERVDTRPEAGSIPNRMRLEILRSRFVIADLTENNLGAYWEAGYAEGLERPVIYTCERKKFEKKKTHFDTNHLTTVLWSADDHVETAKRFKATIRATIPEARREED